MPDRTPVFVVAMIAISLGLAACGPEPTPLDKAYALFASTLASGRAEDVYPSLDQESQWSLQTLVKVVAEMQALVATSYPAERREGGLGMWAPYTAERTPEALFARLLAAWGGVEGLRDGVSGIRASQMHGDEGVVVTHKGRRFPFRKGKDGRWGLALFRDRLGDLKNKAYDHLDLIQKSAAVYETARRGEGHHDASP